MKVYKKDSQLEKDISSVEDLMYKLGIEIYGNLTISYKGTEIKLVDASDGSGRPAYDFPRQTDDERFAVVE